MRRLWQLVRKLWDPSYEGNPYNTWPLPPKLKKVHWDIPRELRQKLPKEK